MKFVGKMQTNKMTYGAITPPNRATTAHNPMQTLRIVVGNISLP